MKKNDNDLHNILEASSFSELDISVKKVFKNMGVNLFTYTSTVLPEKFLTTYPDEFKKEYIEKNFINIDPVVDKSSLGQDFYWSKNMFRSEVFNTSAKFGIEEGWTFSIKGEFGWSAITIVDRDHVRRWNRCSKDSSVFMRQYMNFINTKAQEINFIEKQKRDYSEREIDCLKWARDGKTIEETALIMELSVRTINFYLKNSYDKMGVDNKTAAVSRAILMGIL